MHIKKQTVHRFFKAVVKNAIFFVSTTAFITIFQHFFGSENVLPAVAIVVGLSMFPQTYTGVNIPVTVLTILGLYTSSVVVAQLALTHAFLALPLNFLYVVILFALTCEPVYLQPSISFILCFVFSQATPVSAAAFPRRLAAIFIGGTIVAVATAIAWKRQGYGHDGRTLKMQITLSVKNRSYILRMATGLAVAMFIGMSLHLEKPLWISIVVMSLTQIDLKDTLQRIRYRTLATIIGGTLFFVLFHYFVPASYSMFVVLGLCYLGCFTTQYKYKQIVNAISALNASLLLLTEPMALINRVTCLLGGIIIVLMVWQLNKLYTHMLPRTKSVEQII